MLQMIFLAVEHAWKSSDYKLLSSSLVNSTAIIITMALYLPGCNFFDHANCYRIALMVLSMIFLREIEISSIQPVFFFQGCFESIGTYILVFCRQN